MNNNAQYGFYFNAIKCTGCKTCHIACKDRMVGLERSSLNIPTSGIPDMLNVKWRRIYEYTGGDWAINGDGTFDQNVFTCYTAISCNHCSEPVCVKACPTGAMHKRKEDGLVHIYEELCIGCESCARACPYDAPQIDRDRKIMTKCDGCLDQLKMGRKPICVTSCPLSALDFDTMENLEIKYGKSEAHLAPLPNDSITGPNLIIVNNPKHRQGGKVLNPNEI